MSLPPKNRGAGFSFQSVITPLVLLPSPLIAQYLIVTFDFDLGMRVAYTIMMVAYFAAASRRNLAFDGREQSTKLYGGFA